MLDVDTWQEILDTIRKNRLRTFLTGFSVAWGIFMLIVLLGSGEGLSHGIEHQFRDDAINSIWIFSGQTSVPHRGLQPGRTVQFTNADYDAIRSSVDGVEHITGRFYIRGTLTVSYGREHGTFDVRCVHPGHRFLEKTIVTKGRFLDELDLREYRKTAVIGRAVEAALFRGAPPLGKRIEINGVAFQVVGVFDDAGAEQELEKIYLPITTAQRTFGGANRLAQIMLTTGDASLPATERMSEEIRKGLATRHRFASEDERAVNVENNNEDYARFLGVMKGIRTFVWIIGVGTILAGVVGVSNVMMIAVRERTKEIGIRKALGATPWSIVRLVLQESVLITSVAGYVGLVAGIGLLELASTHLATDFFRDPSVDLRIAVQATAVLVTAGLIAGLIPARRAAAVRPIEALRDE